MYVAATARLQTVKAAAARWADDLIDLGRTNTLLYFKDTKTSTLDLTQSDSMILVGLLTGQKTRLNALITDPVDYKEACVRARNLRKKILAFDEEQGINVGRLARGIVRVTLPAKGSNWLNSVPGYYLTDDRFPARSELGRPWTS